MELEDIKKKIADMPIQPIQVKDNEMAVIFYQDNKVMTIYISLKEDENIGVSLEKGYVIVRTQYETKFVCKGKDFICLWK